MENKTDDLSLALQQMQNNLKKVSDEHTERIWLQTGKNALNDNLIGDKTLHEIAKEILDFIASYTLAQIGTIYVFEDDVLRLQYTYGITGAATKSFQLGEGQVGQAAVKKTLSIINKLPKNYFKIESSFGHDRPDTIVVLPAIFDNNTVAVIELGKFGEFTPIQLKLLEEISEPIAVSINTVVSKKKLETLISQLNAKEKELNNRILAINKSNASIEFDLNGIILSANEIFLDIMGYTANEVVGKHHRIFVEKSEAASKEYHQFWADLKKGEFQQDEFKRVHKNGDILWLQGSYNPVLDTSGKPTKILKIATDITLAKKQQIEIDAITNAIYKSNLVIEFDLNGNVLKSNSIFQNIMGYKESEIKGKHHSVLVEKGFENTKEYISFWEGLKKGEFQAGEFKRVTKSGEILWIKGNYNPIFDAQGNPYKILKIATDITLAKKQQIEIDAITSSIYKSNLAIEFDLNGNILKANDFFMDIMGYKETEIIGKAHSMFVEKGYETSKEYKEFWNSLRRGEFQSGEFMRITKDGNPVWIKGNYNPIFDAQGNPFKILKIATDVTLARNQAQELIKQAEILQMQQEEQMQMNEELEEQTLSLKQQQEELQATNEELEEQTQSLEMKNQEVEMAKNDIEQKTKQLEISSRYKSEFLANMSHELRTPLNSLLILSKNLFENKKKNLDPTQVESAEIIYKSGHDLLVLINEVLDLSKIEAGKMSINVEPVSLRKFLDSLIRDFKHSAEQKSLKLTALLEDSLPEFIHTDLQRLNQILKNLLSNSIKFTEKGSVNLSIKRNSTSTVIISVIDTGIGVQEDKQLAIFEAFQQADGGTSRKYGGTGLGLSISRELAKLLGAEIKISSKINVGSTFSVIIPFKIHQEEDINIIPVEVPVLYKPHAESDPKYLNYPTIVDDRDSITSKTKAVLIIEDDLKFAAILLKLANEKGFKALAAATGEDGLLLTAKYKPQAIILDMRLPGMNGHSVLHELKADPSVRHIPVHIMSADKHSLEPIKEGAVECLMKPVEKEDLEKAFGRIENFVNRKIKNLLIVEDNVNSRKAMLILIGDGDVKCFEAGKGEDALAIYKKNQIDCIILDLGLPDMTGFELIHKLKTVKAHNLPPIIVYTGKELSKEENRELQKYAESIIIKGIKSEERLLDETALFLHRTIVNLPESKQLIINSLYDKEAVFHSKKILLVDDDSRNIFALSRVLKESGMEIITAENGKQALEMLAANPAIDIVLMDIMMPIMDGYEAMKGIRSQKKFKNLPVIALTAKAMKEDKQKCIDAGANDYITKPIDVERLLSLMRVWLSK